MPDQAGRGPLAFEGDRDDACAGQHDVEVVEKVSEARPDLDLWSRHG